VEIPMPLDKTKDIASVFLCWLYRQKIMWTLLVAKELAEIGHFWNISLLPPECEDFLVAEAGKTPSFLRNIGAEDLLGWLDIADKCGDRFLPFCTAEFFLRGKEFCKSDALSRLSPRLHSLMMKSLLENMEIPESMRAVTCKTCGTMGLQYHCFTSAESHWQEILYIQTSCVVCKTTKTVSGASHEFGDLG